MEPRKNRVRNPSFEVGTARWSASMATLARVAGGAPPGGSYCGRLTQSALAVHGGEGREVRRNLVPNPSFESMSLSAWASGGGSRSGEQALFGSSSLKQTNTNGPQSVPVPVEGGAQHAYSLHALPVGAASSVRLSMSWKDADGGALGLSVAPAATALPAGQWTRASLVASAPPGAASVVLYTQPLGSGPSAWHYDAAMLEKAATVGDYFDGSTAPPPGFHNEWADGVANDSASVQRVNEAVATYTDDDARAWSADRDEAHAFSAYVRAISGWPARSASARVRWLHPTTGDLVRTTYGPSFATVPGGWVRVSAASDAPGFGTALLDVVVEGMALGESHDVDAALFERGDAAGGYFDGDAADAPFLTYGPGPLASGLAHAWLTQQGSRAPHDAASFQVDALGFDRATYAQRAADGGWAAVMDRVAAVYFE